MAAKTFLKTALTIFAILFLLAHLTFAALPRYEIIDLGTLGGYGSRAMGINDKGQVVGASATYRWSNEHAFLWDPINGMTDLGTLPGHCYSSAGAINDYGIVVGCSDPYGDQAYPVIWDPVNGMRPIPSVSEYEGSANYINNRGQVVGVIWRADAARAFLWEDGLVVVELPTLGGRHSSAGAINNTGKVVGSSETTVGDDHAYLWDTDNGMRDLGTLGGINSVSYAINDAGQVVGWAETVDDDWHAFLWDEDAGMTDLGPGIARSINNAGQVVGDLSYMGPAFYWDSTVGMIPLSDLLSLDRRWQKLRFAGGINNHSQIVGMGITNSGKEHAFLMTPVPPKTIYVDDDAAGANDGSSWADAFNFLQDALAAAWSSDEIRVAQGVYKPDQGAGITPGEREATFQLINGVNIKGGYAGFGEPDPDTRNVDTYQAVLSGDLKGDDGPNFAKNGENSYHVVIGYQTDSMEETTDVLDGFSVTGGNANGSSYPGNCGGGMLCNSDATVSNCTFTGNFAVYGGGMYCGPSWCCVTCPTLNNCMFIGNSASEDGGGLWVGDSDPTLSNCKISANSAGKDGGGLMFGNDNFTTMLNCLINANSAGEDGGGIYGVFCFRWKMANCTSTGNSAEARGGGIYNQDGSDMTLTNCILWGDSPEEISGEWTDWVTVNHSCIQGGWSGNENIDTDPLFVDANGVDNVVGTEDDNLRLPPDSPCIDTGDPNYIAEPNETDLDGNPRVVRGRIDMGAYEFQGQLILYVDDDAAGANDGSCWADAFNYLQDALTAAWSGDEIHVAEGTYKPDQGVGQTPGDREATFQLINGVTLKGGFAGIGNPDPGARRINLYETILTGDLNSDDVDVIDPCDLLTEPTRVENCYHVVSAIGTDTTAMLDGFTIAAGKADHPISWPEDHRSYGGGLYIEKWCHATVLNCTFTTNSGRMGGAICYDHGKPVISNCCFVDNAANKKGGGISDGWSSRATVTNCTFNNNWSHFGGGMFTCGSETILTQCTFNANRAYHGGGIYNEISDPVANSCLFTGNWARYGGAIYNEEESEPIFVNCTFSGNAAPYDPYNETGGDGGAINHWSGSRSNLTNCILWGDSPDEISGGRNLVSYCCIQGWSADIGGVGNIDADPCFANPGYWADFSDPNTIIEPNEPNAVWVDGDYHLLPSSPCIDAGDPNYIAEPNETDLDGKLRVLDGDNDGIAVVDMGAYEYWFIISAEARIVPRTINLASKGKWITAFIWLPEEFYVNEIEPDSVLLAGEIKPEKFWLTEDNQTAIAKFDREDVQAILDVGQVELKITGQLTDGTAFEATDTIKVINKVGKNRIQ